MKEMTTEGVEGGGEEQNKRTTTTTTKMRVLLTCTRVSFSKGSFLLSLKLRILVDEERKEKFNSVNVYGSPIAIKASVTEANKPFSSLIKYCKESQDNNLKHKQNSILSYYNHNFFKLIIFFIVCLETKIIKGSYTFKLFQRLGTRAIYEELLHSFTHLFQPTNTHKLSNGMKFTLIVNL